MSVIGCAAPPCAGTVHSVPSRSIAMVRPSGDSAAAMFVPSWGVRCTARGADAGVWAASAAPARHIETTTTLCMADSLHAPRSACRCCATSDRGARSPERLALRASGRSASLSGQRQLPDHERNAAAAPERVLVGKDLLLDAIFGAEHLVDLTHRAEALDAGLHWEDPISFT